MPPETDKLEQPPPSPSEELDEPGVKWCEYGQHFLPADTDNFGANRASEDGLSTWCREHSREHDRTRSKDHEEQKKRRKAAYKKSREKTEHDKQVTRLNDMAKKGKVIPHGDELAEAFWKHKTPAEFGEKVAEEFDKSTGMGFTKNAKMIWDATVQANSSGTENTDDMTEEDMQREIREALTAPQLAEETAGPEFPVEYEADEDEDENDEISRAS